MATWLNDTTIRDYKAGQSDKKAGYYDKWYRYNRADDGKAYDLGFNAAETKKEIHIIEMAY